MRVLTAEADAALASGLVPLCVLIELQLEVTIRLCLAGVNFEWDGHAWMGCGTAAGMEPVTDSAGDRKGVQFSLSSVPNELLNLALEEQVQGKRVIVYLAICDPVTYQVLDVDRVFSGILGQPEVGEGDPDGVVTVSAETRQVSYSRVKPLRYIDSDQRRLYPGDTSLRFIATQSGHQDIWPSAAWGAQ